MNDYDAIRPYKAGLILSTSVMIVAGLLLFAVLYVVIGVFAPRWVGFAFMAPAVVLCVFYYFLPGLVLKMITWRSDDPMVTKEVSDARHQ